MTRAVWLIVGYVATGLAIVGAVLPLMPSTVFLFVAVYAFARSSPRLHNWLTTHPHFGPLLDDWNRYGAIRPKAKVAAVAGMVLSLGMTWLLGVGVTLLVVQAAVLALVAAFLLSRPNGPSAN